MMRARRASRSCSQTRPPGRGRSFRLVTGTLVVWLITNVHAAAFADPIPVPPVDAPVEVPAGDPVGDAVDEVGDAVDDATGDGNAPPAVNPPSGDAGVEVEIGTGETGGSQGGDADGDQAPSPGGSSPQPSTGSNESSASVANVAAGDQPIAGVGNTDANHGNGGSGAGASSLGALGHEATGTHSSSSGAANSEATGGVAAHSVCQGSGGDLCLALLYENAASGPGEARADGVLLGACVGGQTDPSQPCGGPVDIAVGGSSSSASGYSSTLFGACFGGNGGGTGPCTGIGATLLSADESAGGDRNEVGAAIEVGGHQLVTIGHPEAIPSCSHLLVPCATFNEGNITGSGTDAAPSDGGSGGGSDGGPAAASAEGAVVEIALGDRGVAGVSGSEAGADGDGSSADATVVSVLGQEVIGAHADAEDGSSEAETGLLTQTCAATGGEVCAALLYGHASADAGDGGSQGSSDSAVASACMFGNQPSPDDNCDGVVGAAALESHSEASADNGAGAASSDQWSNVADVCIGGENGSGTCQGAGAELIHSESHSAAATDVPASSDADSSLASAEIGGDDAATVDGGGEIPAECSQGASLACVILSQAATDAAAGATTGSATAATFGLIPGANDGGDFLVGGGVGQATTGADLTADEQGFVDEPEAGGDEPDAPGDEPDAGDPGEVPEGEGPDEPGDPNAPDDPAGDGPDDGSGQADDPDDGEVAGAGLSAGNLDDNGGDVLGAAERASGGELPFTGGSELVIFGAGLMMMAAGAVLLSIARMRRH